MSILNHNICLQFHQMRHLVAKLPRPLYTHTINLEHYRITCRLALGNLATKGPTKKRK